MENFKVSVVVPVYNVEQYLSKCLDSLLKQTLKEIEIICVNDGSTDNSPEILKEYAEKYSNIVVVNKENGGLSSARNAGVCVANGHCITFLDSDDWVNDVYLEKLYDAITRNDADIAFACMVRKRTNSEKYRLKYTEEKVYTELQDKIDVCDIPNCCYVCGKLFRLDLIKNKIFKSGVYFEDVIWLPEIIKQTKNLVVVPDSYYYYMVNAQSIVKSAQGLEKQHDSYVAKSYIVKFFNENNLKLKDKNKKVNKYIKQLFGFPISRIKEVDGYEIEYLFDLIPISKKKSSQYYKFKKDKRMFLFKKLDSHLYLNIFKVHLGFKIKDKFNYEEVTEYGLTKEKRDVQIIVSLTSFPDRINKIYKTISTILNQTIKPDRLILWLSEDQFPNKENDLPESLMNLVNFGLEIRWCENLRSYRKLVPTLREFPNDIIVTADDDLYYQKDWLESLYNAYLKDNKNIYTRRACRLSQDGVKIKLTPHYDNNNFEPSYCNQLMGGAGTLYPPNSLHKDVLDSENIKNLIPTYDDIYFWVMALANKTKIGLVENKDLNIYTVENTQESGLCKQNNIKVNSIGDKEAFNIMFEKYPQIVKLLREKK